MYICIYLLLNLLFFMTGSFGVHTTMSPMDKESHEFYGKLGFIDYQPGQDENPGVITMFRSF